MPANDARLWARLMGEFRAAGLGTEEADRHARRAVAIVRRERATTKARTFAPGDEIPIDVMRAYDLDGDRWERLPGDPESTAKDMWRMPGFNADEHEGDAGGCYVTPHLLDKYGPLTEIRPHGKMRTGTQPPADPPVEPPDALQAAMAKVRRDLGARLLTRAQAEKALVEAGCTQGAAEIHVIRFALDRSLSA